MLLGYVAGQATTEKLHNVGDQLFVVCEDLPQECIKLGALCLGSVDHRGDYGNQSAEVML